MFTSSYWTVVAKRRSHLCQEPNPGHPASTDSYSNSLPSIVTEDQISEIILTEFKNCYPLVYKYLKVQQQLSAEWGGGGG